MNPAFARMLGLAAPEELQAVHADALFLDPVALVDSLDRGGEPSSELRLRRAEGTASTSGRCETARPGRSSPAGWRRWVRWRPGWHRR
ncbi:MAG TPA: hypothetical protein VMU15_02315 [Anaeromyxobacter sp.]|nr:hypothetical protein [Anaeromyxobacter sp.]